MSGMQARRSMEIDLRRALAFKELQAGVSTADRPRNWFDHRFRALIRWQHPVRGRVSPADFVLLAEEIGVIVPIGEWVLRTACKQAAAWETPAKISVNLSPVQFRSGKLVETVCPLWPIRVCRRAGLSWNSPKAP
jgi:EAL domain-containing protein (putative c-di-GMP-specific phosphodiesterase class I)